MALSGSALKAKMRATIKAGLEREFGSEIQKGKDYSPIAQAQWEKMASAIADIAVDIVTAITTQAEVVPGIPVATVGGPSNQAGATTGPGKIL